MRISAEAEMPVQITHQKFTQGSNNSRLLGFSPKDHFCVARTIFFGESSMVTDLVTVDGNRMAGEASLLAWTDSASNV